MVWGAGSGVGFGAAGSALSSGDLASDFESKNELDLASNWSQNGPIEGGCFESRFAGRLLTNYINLLILIVQTQFLDKTRVKSINIINLIYEE